MAKFDITAAFAAAVGNVSDSDTSREAIEYIGLDKLEADPGNFYSLTGLEDLAANIELCGLQQPIRVRPTEDGRYVIVSGHRRWSALKLLRSTEGSGDRWASIPCIVERDEASQELRELRLILANSSTRVLSPAEVSKQAQRVELLLYQLKEQGYEFPGRMRDQVAAACQVSAPKLARLKVIRERLIPAYLEVFDRNKLPEQTAYVLARMETALQERLANMLPNLPTGSRAEELLDDATPNFNPLVDPKCCWALNHPAFFPVEINTASRETLLRVPGIGVGGARRIVVARRAAKLDFSDLKKMRIVLKRAKYFITCKGKMMAGIGCDTAQALNGLLQGEGRKLAFTLGAQQLSLLEPTVEDTYQCLSGQL